jgi:hypothetical protein
VMSWSAFVMLMCVSGQNWTDDAGTHQSISLDVRQNNYCRLRCKQVISLHLEAIDDAFNDVMVIRLSKGDETIKRWLAKSLLN